MSHHFKVGDIVQYVDEQLGGIHNTTYEVTQVNNHSIKIKGTSRWLAPDHYRLVRRGNSEVAEAKRLLESMGYTIDRPPFNGEIQLDSHATATILADRKMVVIRTGVGTAAVYFNEFEKIAEVVLAAKKYNEES